MKRAEIERLLPEVYQRTLIERSALWVLLQIMEDLHRPVEERLQEIGDIFDPRRTPDRFVPHLASWSDLERLFPQRKRVTDPFRLGRGEQMPLDRLRELCAHAAWLSRWRGTRKGLQQFLEHATGENRIRIHENVTSSGIPHPFHLVVVAPLELSGQRALIEAIVAAEKPAFVTHELQFLAVSPEPAAATTE